MRVVGPRLIVTVEENLVRVGVVYGGGRKGGFSV